MNDVKKFGWAPEDFEKAKEWASNQMSLKNPNLSLWEYLQKENDSVYIIHEINKHIEEISKMNNKKTK